MKKLLLIVLLASPCFGSGPKYIGSKTDPLISQEFGNVYNDIRNPVINIGQASTMTVTYLVVSTISARSIQGVTDAWTSYTPTFTGFSAAPTFSGAYKLIGKTCFVRGLVMAGGTSNATTFTLTLPFPSNAAQQDGFGTSFDGGVRQTSPAKIITRGASAVADVYKDFGLTGWTNSGTKYLEDFFITYETQ